MNHDGSGCKAGLADLSREPNVDQEHAKAAAEQSEEAVNNGVGKVNVNADEDQKPSKRLEGRNDGAQHPKGEPSAKPPDMPTDSAKRSEAE